jgi:exonuclease III
LIRSASDKNNDNIDYRWVDKFNTWVDMWALLEINLAGRAYTWGNNQENQVMCRLDRVFCTTHFDSAFPLANIRALARIGSDHTPIVWDSGETKPQKRVVLNLKNGGWLFPSLRTLC